VRWPLPFAALTRKPGSLDLRKLGYTRVRHLGSPNACHLVLAKAAASGAGGRA